MPKRHSKGFTLIELLVVIAVIALLMAVVMPALRKAKDHAKKIHCSANLRSLSMAVLMYADNNDARTPSSTNVWQDGNTNKPGWCGRTMVSVAPPVLLSIDEQIYGTSDPVTGLERGQLWPYIETPDAWRCPSDLVKENMRSYCMSSQWWGTHTNPDDSVWFASGTAGLVYRQINKIKNPGGRFLFVDQLGLNDDAFWAIPYSTKEWWNIPSYMHSSGSVNGFSDGHVEAYKLGAETVKLAQESMEEAIEGVSNFMMKSGKFNEEDLVFYQRATWGKIGWQ
jgi:prepilin-type N-terminal cleavage/methylation domain-containing protein